MESTSEHALARINSAVQRIERASKNIDLAQSRGAGAENDDAQALRREASEVLAMLDSVIRKAEIGND